MNLNTRITGPAGAGVNSAVDIITKIFAELGYDLVTDIEYESRIKGGINYFDVNISDEKDKFLTKKVDILLAFNSASLNAQIPYLSDNATIISPNLFQQGETGFNVINIDSEGKYVNIYLLGVYGKYLNFDLDILLEKVVEVFAKKGAEVIEKNKEIIRQIFQNYPLKPLSIQHTNNKPKDLIYGNKAIALGAIESDLEFYSAYPMTPASTILTEIINSGKVKYIQNEDEIAVINSALGASFTGVRAMSGTSGGGFALMTEALSFAIQAEIPITIVLSQRAGPSTGTPTYHEMGDINFALYPTFGDYEHIVLYPSNLEEAYFFAGLSLNLAQKYQTIVILLTDKQASEMFATTDKLEPAKVNRGEFLDSEKLEAESLKGNGYKRYEITPSGISPMVKVGTKNGDFIASSYEHDEYGATTENSELKKAMTEKRWRKLKNFFEKEDLVGYEIINPKAQKMLVTMSFISYTAKKFIKENPEFGLVIIKFLKPLDMRLKDELVGKKELIFVENNYSGQLENYIVKEFGLSTPIPQPLSPSQEERGGNESLLKISHLRKYDLMPFYLEDFNSLK